MALPKDRFDRLFKQIPESEKKSLLDYMEYLAERAMKKAWGSIDEVNEPLTEEEKKEIAKAKEDSGISLEELKRELKL